MNIYNNISKVMFYFGIFLSFYLVIYYSKQTRTNYLSVVRILYDLASVCPFITQYIKDNKLARIHTFTPARNDKVTRSRIVWLKIFLQFSPYCFFIYSLSYAFSSAPLKEDVSFFLWRFPSVYFLAHFVIYSSIHIVLKIEIQYGK